VSVADGTLDYMSNNWVPGTVRQVDGGKLMAQTNAADTARATRESQELIEQLVAHSVATAAAADVRERQMLRWTQAGVGLAAIAAVASIAAIVVTLAVGGG